MLDLNLILRALKTHQLAIKQAITLSNQATLEKAKRPYRPAEPHVLARILSESEMQELEQELSQTAMQVLLIEHMYD
jgi:hypothetical protein